MYKNINLARAKLALVESQLNAIHAEFVYRHEVLANEEERKQTRLQIAKRNLIQVIDNRHKGIAC